MKVYLFIVNQRSDFDLINFWLIIRLKFERVLKFTNDLIVLFLIWICKLIDDIDEFFSLKEIFIVFQDKLFDFGSFRNIQKLFRIIFYKLYFTLLFNSFFYLLFFRLLLVFLVETKEKINFPHFLFKFIYLLYLLLLFRIAIILLLILFQMLILCFLFDFLLILLFFLLLNLQFLLSRLLKIFVLPFILLFRLFLIVLFIFQFLF